MNVLGYYPAPSRRRAWLRRGIWLLAATFVATLGWRWGPAIWRQTNILHSQRQCMNYIAPADLVVYEEESVAAAKLLAAGSQYVGYRRTSGWWPGKPPASVIAAAFVPACWTRFSSSSGVRAPMGIGAMPPQGAAIVFLHERISPAGNRRLVCVRSFPDPSAYDPTSKPEPGRPQLLCGYDCDTFAFTPATLRKLPLDNGNGSMSLMFSDMPLDRGFERMYAGQPDPSDPSHFSIRYKMWNRSTIDTLDGKLNDDDSITLTLRG